MPDVLMPRLSDSMVEGTVIRWLADHGAKVRRGEEIAEIETDKATMPLEAEVDGVLSHLVAAGDTRDVGETVAVIGAEVAQGRGKRDEPPATAPSTELGAAQAKPEVLASPVARRVATRLGVDLGTVAGSGPRGRILKADVERAAPGQPAAPPSDGPGNDAAAAETAKGAVTVERLSRVQQTIARRMAESKATVPEFSLDIEVDMEAAVELREALRGDLEPLPSFNDLIVKATARALRANPRVNGAYRDGAAESYGRVNVGIAVAAPDSLLVPVLRDADRMTLGALAAESRRLAARARDGSLTAAELSGGTFTVSNLGMFGTARFAGVINPPQAGILCLGALRPRPAVLADGSVGVRRRMWVTLVSDHRIIYGADAAAFLEDVRIGIERPATSLAS
jgi:pyruvate dehydrogenase E2 component (dihydrolipoamide acetyltransferase)